MSDSTTTFTERLARLSPAKRALLEKKLAEEKLRLDRLVVPPRPPAERERCPLSFAQERLWFIDKMMPGSPLYNIPGSMPIRGELDRRALERALGEVIRRHEPLRTVFVEEEGVPVQAIRPPGPFPLPAVDLGALAREDRGPEADRLMAAEAASSFDLGRGPLIRALLLRLEAERHVLLFNLHHIVSDGWSNGILFQELVTLYRAFAAGAPSPLPPLPVQFGDFASWQRTQLTGEELERQLSYWRAELEWVPPVLDLPVDRPRPQQAGFAGASLPLEVPEPASEAVLALGRTEGATLFMTLLALLQTLLFRHTGERSPTVGTPIAGRKVPEVEGLIGYFANTLVMRARIDPRQSFRSLLAATREVVVGAHEHQDLPFERLVEELAVERSMSHAPLFQVLYVLQNAPARAAEAVPGLEFGLSQAHSGTTKAELTFSLMDSGGRLLGQMEYKTDLFDRTTVLRLQRHLYALMLSAAADPETAVGSLPMLSAAERHQMVHEWNDGRKVEEEAVFLHDLVLAQASRDPEAPALLAEGIEVTFDQVALGSARLANHLLALGVRPETVVAVALPRSPELVITILAVLRAGGAFLPLEPDTMAERLAQVLDDAQSHGPVRLLLTSSEFALEVPEGVRAVYLDREEAVIAGAGDRVPEVGLVPENAAYVLFTSGSTGRPKGVVIAHRAIGRRILWNLLYDRPPEPFVNLQKASITFDVSLFEIFFPLVAGGLSVQARSDRQWDVPYLMGLVREHGITQIAFPPSLHAVLLEMEDLAELGASLRQLYTSGEAVPPDLPRRLHERLPRELINRYGPTETTVGMMQWTCEPWETGRPVPIGRPFASAEVFLLDRQGRLVPAGVPGELAIGGSCLARGYHDRPARTATSFVPHPFARRPGQRLYRSGDLCRARADGAVEFLARIDHQVKVRGFRIELGEVEHALREHAAVLDAAVVDREEASGLVQLVGYAEAVEGASLEPRTLRSFLEERLPAHMVPAHLVCLEKLPRLASGKVDRRRLPEPERESETPQQAPRTELEGQIAAVWREVLGLSEVGVTESFFEIGGHSLLLVQVQSRLQKVLGREIPVVDLFRFPTIASLADFLGGADRQGEEVAAGAERARLRASLRSGAAEGEHSGIAIIAMTGRFPGAESVPELWENLCAGREGVRHSSVEELIEMGVTPSLLENPDYVRAQGMIEKEDYFDATVFGVNPREAQLMDPQHRLFLECALETLEEAGYDPDSYGGAIGVFAGVGASRYWLSLFLNPELAPLIGSMQTAIGNEKDFLPTRISYKLNLKGPSVNMQCACSTSLVAAHLACQSLLDGECDMALAGGVSVLGDAKGGYVYEEAGILSPDGHCRAFDAQAQGTVVGNGAGIVLLKPLTHALRDGDRVHAVIRGSAVNNDGSFKIGFTAPSIQGQTEVIAQAQAMAGFAPETIGYVEAHGTGTELGDPIEVEALRSVFGTEPGHTCALGSIKTNLGHLNTAAGVTGLIKAALTVEHGRIPPSLHFETPNPKIDFENSPFYVASELGEWPLAEGPRRAGVSSFGLGGTNVHMVLEEVPSRPASGPSRSWQLLVLSAATLSALDRASANLSELLRCRPEVKLGDMAFTLQLGRRAMAHRRVLVADSVERAAEALAPEGGPDAEVLSDWVQGGAHPVVFLFPGQGSQHAAMGLELYREEPVFRRHLERCTEILRPLLGEDLLAVLGAPDAGERLRQTSLTQPALFAVEYSLARQWMAWGVRPAAMIGHSIGEYVAATLAGVFELEDVLPLVVERGRLLQAQPAGCMTSVLAPQAEVEDRLRGFGGETLALAAVNAPDRVVVAGSEEEVTAFEAALAAEEVFSRRLHTSHAFHSSLMEEAVAPFRRAVEQVATRPPVSRFYSNVTGRPIEASSAASPEYWARHLRRPVLFSQALEGALEEGDPLFLEVGPGQSLSSLAKGHPAVERRRVVASLGPAGEPGSERAHLLRAAGELWLSGVEIDWAELHAGERRHRIQLPTYPFERERYWIETTSPAFGPAAAPAGKIEDPGRWFYAPSWKLTVPPPPLEAAESEAESAAPCHLLFVDSLGLGVGVARRLAESGRDVVVVRSAEAFERVGDSLYEIDPGEREHYEALLHALAEEGRAPVAAVHFWSVTGEAGGGEAAFEEAQRLGLFSLLHLGQALLGRARDEPFPVTVVSDGLWSVDGSEELHPEKGTLSGALRVIPQEYRDLPCRGIDVVLPEPGSWQEADLLEQLTAEILAPAAEITVAYRRGGRYALSFEPIPFSAERASGEHLQRRGVYFLTGGLGRMGLRLADHLGRRYQARLALVGRSPLPAEEAWPAYLESHAEDDPVSRKILVLQDLVEAGAEVLVLSADVADGDSLAAAVEETRRRFGGLDGVVHLAGTMGEDLMTPFESLDPEACRRQFRPKTQGLYALERALGEEPLDFCVVYSSLSAVLGGLGFTAYAAANSFMDAFVHAHNRRHPVPWVSGDWDGLPHLPLLVEEARSLAAGGGDEAPPRGEFVMTTGESLEAFERLLYLRRCPQVVVSTGDLERRLSAWLDPEPEPEAEETSFRGDRPELRTPYVAPSDPTEDALTEIWQELLGIEKVGVEDHYFELGGDSLLATQMLSRVRRSLKAQISFADFFDGPTVAAMAKKIRGGEEEDLDELEKLLGDIEEIAEDDVDAEISRLREDGE